MLKLRYYYFVSVFLASFLLLLTGCFHDENKDSIPPVITVLGNNPVSIAQNANYEDAGATAVDDKDGVVPVSRSGVVDVSVIGVYTVIYNAQDSAGNVATAVRVVNVLDDELPVITVLGENPISVKQGASYNDAGAIATDNIDGVINVESSGSVDTATVGAYTISYTAIDSSGNTATAKRVITVKSGGSTSSNTPIKTLSVDLVDYITNTLTYVQSSTEGYVAPTAAELISFDTLVSSLLNGLLNTVNAAASGNNFELIEVTDTGDGNNVLYCLQELASQGQGFFCVDLNATNTHHISTPHPKFDSNTENELMIVVRATNAKYISLSTTHRCANVATSSCSGTTSACGAVEPYKVSDMAHNVDTYFYNFGITVHNSSASLYTVQLHGCGSGSCPSNGDNNDVVARLSAGTTTNLDASEKVNQLNTALNTDIAAFLLGESRSCSDVAAVDKLLCGTTNTLGRFINGQADPCQNSATSFTSSRWLHIEQNSNLRRDIGGGDEITPNNLINALNATL